MNSYRLGMSGRRPSLGRQLHPLLLFEREEWKYRVWFLSVIRIDIT